MPVDVYQTSHLLSGFIGEFAGHLNSFENACKFDNGPMTRNLGGACGSFSICRFVVSSVTAEHQTCCEIGTESNNERYAIFTEYLNILKGMPYA